jgi:hypothetical protein
MSNTNQAFGGFMQVAKQDKEVNPRVKLVNGDMGGITASAMQDEQGVRRQNRQVFNADFRRGGID